MALGQQGMMDTMGQAAALTGGYGNSYAQTAGQQTYQGYLQQLNDRIPDLYQLALSKYQLEGNALADQYAMLGTREDQDYGRYRDSVSDYYAELQRLYSQFATEREYDYGKHIDERNYQYQQDRDAVSDQQWQTQYDEAVRQWQAEYDENKRRYDQEYGQKYGSGSNSTNTNPDSESKYNADTAKTQQMLKDAGYDIAVDGVWGPETQKAYDDYQKNGGNQTLTSAGEKFMQNLPYPHAGSDISVWKKTVYERLKLAYNNGSLSDSDVTIIAKKLGLTN